MRESNWSFCLVVLASNVMPYVWGFLIGIGSNIATIFGAVAVAYAKRRWIIKALGNINWKLSGDVWWLCCDLHSVKLQAYLNHPERVGKAISKASEHARVIGVDKEMLSQIEALHEINPTENAQIQERVDPIIDHFGKLAISSQPDFTH